MPPSHPPEEPSFALLVEALEARIAPTGLTGLTNNPNLASDPRYLSYDTAPVPGQKLGFIPVGDDVFAIQLSGDSVQNPDGTFPNADKIVIFSSTGGFNLNRPFLQATDGQTLAFFRDFNGDRQIQTNELVGLSMGNAAGAIVNGTINGDVVANLGADGLSVVDDGRTSFQTIARLNVTTGDVTGSILAGGGLNNVTVANKVGNLLAGTAADGYGYHFSGLDRPVSGFATVFLPGDGQVGGGITNTSVGALDSAHTGTGGFGAAGGPINTFVVNTDTDGFVLQSGAGGFGAGGVKGGTGGLISNVTVGLKGSLNDPTAHDPISIIGGKGGNSVDGFKSGVGGSLDNVAIGFTLDPNNNRQQSTFLLAENVTLQAGDGGDGFKAGTGGAVTNSQVIVGTPDNADFVNNPAVVKILGGDGGAQISGGLGGKGGKGGGVLSVDVRDLNTDQTRLQFTGLPAGAAANNAQLLIHGGDGGPVLDGGKGKFGGTVDGVTLLGYRLDVSGGDGAPGNTGGGAGGSVNNVNVLSRSDLLPTEFILDAGRGARADNGFGGSGGNISTVRVANSAFNLFLINSGDHANGGEAQGDVGGTGGAGGSVTDVLVTGSRPFLTASNAAVPVGTAILRGGDGGLGANGGGSGGSLNGVTVVGSNFDFQVLGGNGGGAFAIGNGGAGGAINSVGVVNQATTVSFEQLQSVPNASGLVRSGTGGMGAGNGVGGPGGALLGVNVITTRDATLTAGDGGPALLGAAGQGGSIQTSTAQALFGSVNAHAGNAGPFATLPGNGGTVDGFVADAGRLLFAPGQGITSDLRPNQNAGNIAIAAGDGHAGGAGGSVLNSGVRSLNAGGLLVTAGAGSGQNGVNGAGGSIDTFSGFVGAFGPTRFVAGAGGNGNGGPNVAGNGGSINAVVLNGAGVDLPGATFDPAPGSFAQPLTFDAGQGGDANGGRKGGAGGSITNVVVSNLANNTVLHHFAAGDGGNAAVKGGRGGSLTGIHVGLPGERADIGMRSGTVFGYSDVQNQQTGQFANAGGLFAGAGGAGSPDRALKPGNVTDVTAAAIASIVAGKGRAPQLAGTVDRIFLEGLNQTGANGAANFTNFDTANLVGSVVNPILPGGGGTVFKYEGMPPGGGTYHFGDIPLDGLVAAVNLTQNRNFIPEALLSIDLTGGGLQLVDPIIPGNPGVTAVNAAT